MQVRQLELTRSPKTDVSAVGKMTKIWVMAEYDSSWESNVARCGRISGNTTFVFTAGTTKHEISALETRAEM